MKKPLRTRIQNGLFRLLEWLLIPVEKVWLFFSRPLLKKRPAHGVIFIIGAPRSGTTLLYQLMVNYFKVSYFNNITGRLCRAPRLAFWLFGKIRRPDSSDYQSQHGRTRGLWGPHEAGDYWYRWFPRGRHVYVPSGKLEAKTLADIRETTETLTRIAGEPILFKNTYNSMRLAPLCEALPRACFIVCLRDPLQNAQSILLARIRNSGDKGTWWSVPPKEIDEIEAHPYWRQVVEQVYFIDKQIKDDSQEFGPHRFFFVRYEELCRSPRETLNRIHEFLEARGIEVRIRDSKVPSRFSVSASQKVEDEDFDKIREVVAELWK